MLKYQFTEKPFLSSIQNMKLEIKIKTKFFMMKTQWIFHGCFDKTMLKKIQKNIFMEKTDLKNVKYFGNLYELHQSLTYQRYRI